MSAIRLARGATRRDRILKFAGCYHGHADALLASAGSGLATLGIPSTPGVPTGADRRHDRLPVQRRRRGRGGRRALRRGARLRHRRAGRREHGRRPARARASSRRCARSATRRGALLVFDEVITGFRVARGGAQERFGVAARPDRSSARSSAAACRSRAFGGRAEVMEQLAPAGDVYQAGTLSGNPLATAAGPRRCCAACATPAVYERARATRRPARGGARAVRPRPARRRDADAVLARRAGAQLRRRAGVRHRALRRALPPPARARRLPRAVAVRGDVRLARARRRGDRPDGGGRCRLLRD